MLKQFACILFIFIVNITFSTFAFQDINESAELITGDQYQFGITPQLASGGNIGFFLDAPINESTSSRFLLSTGDIDFNFFASAKYVPYPDVDRQPAMGIRGGIGFARENRSNIPYFEITPIISKKTSTQWGPMTPYIAVPFHYNITKDNNYFSSSMAFGVELNSEKYPGVHFGGELGLSLSKTESYLSAFATFPFDAKKGF